MTTPIPVGERGKQPETEPGTSGEGAQTALAAMIRKRKSSENRVEFLPDPHPGADEKAAASAASDT